MSNIPIVCVMEVKRKIGGTTTFAKHLKDLLLYGGYQPFFVELAGRSSRVPVSGWRETPIYRVTQAELLYLTKQFCSILISPLGEHLPLAFLHECLENGSKMFIHSSEAATKLKSMQLPSYDNVAVARHSLAPLINNGNIISLPIPYTFHKFPEPISFKKTHGAVAICRITSSKQIDIILKANRILLNDMHLPPIEIYGPENRLYTYRSLCKEIPEFKQGSITQLTTTKEIMEILSRTQFIVNLSKFPKNTVGHAEYSVLEGWNAQTVPIIHKNWYLPGDDMTNKNSLGIESPEELASVVSKFYLVQDREKWDRYMDELVCEGRKILLERRSENLWRLYAKWLFN